ncbi:probable sugar phosphate/phosphate translocator At1g06470 [Phalaenopsis equestris]|uniref:probable sugar phosphate/phosphate translocator At1g06470 n=1 Tax=Phalaenopsis equestris TaxID=78828 RepID=UPI0009E31576|nr:probable sugar phosphate/phosphate translocator At1g06470 [Phalaenopsis equestris]XP_020575892.1 probable sugar phosphate/phosphate translocator At1g06470 [Phalaenopsis equestris]
MGENDLIPENEGEEKSVSSYEAEVCRSSLSDGTEMPVICKEPSFSRWCDEEEVFGRSIPATDGSCECGTAEGSEEFDLPLLQVGGSERTHPSFGGKWSNDFRQRSMNMASLEGNGDGKRYIPLSFDSENSVHNSDSVAKLESLEAEQNSLNYVLVLKTLFFILVWYIFSTWLTLYNKTLLGDDLGRFPAPLLMNTVHFSLQAVLAKVITCFLSRRSEKISTMTWKDYFFRVVPTALGTALDINLSNASLVFISVTFATMCKSASPIFLLLFAFAFRLETPSFKLLGIILIISFGVLLTVLKETQFDFWGFVLVMLASVMSGFRWSMTQILLQKESYGLKNPITLMSHVTPVMALATAILSLLLDPWHDLKSNKYFDSSKHMIISSLLMLFGGALAFFMVLTEYILVSATSAVTVTIAGIVKEAVTILVAVFYFHDQFTVLKGMGLLVIIVGVSLFNWYKYHKLQKDKISAAEAANFKTSNGASNYVIIDEIDMLDEEEMDIKHDNT